MKHSVITVLFVALCSALRAEDLPVSDTDLSENGYLAIEGSVGYNTRQTSEYWRTPLFFTGGSAQREISTRFLLLSDVAHASDYFSGNDGFMKPRSLYLFNYGLIDVDYLSWSGKIWALGFGAGLAHQGFLISGAQNNAHAITLRLRAQGFLYWFDYLATQVVITLPVAVYQSSTSDFRMFHSEINMLFDFKGRVRNPEPQSFMFSLSLHHDYTRINHLIRSYDQHEFTPMLKAMVLY